MVKLDQAGTYLLGGRAVRRLGYGTMQLAGPHAYGPPRDRDAALAVLRVALEAGVDHIDTADFYGPHIVNALIREALSPYPDHLTIVTKIGTKRGGDASWNRAASPTELRSAVHDNLRHLGVDRLDVVNYRCMIDPMKPAEGSINEEVTALADMRREGLIGAIGLSNVTAAQVREAQAISPIACVQNLYNLAHRDDDALVDELAESGIAFVPFFPMGGFSPLQSSTLSSVAERLDATPLQVALAWLLHRSPNILLIPGTSSVVHLHENLASVEVALNIEVVAELDAMC